MNIYETDILNKKKRRENKINENSAQMKEQGVYLLFTKEPVPLQTESNTQFAVCDLMRHFENMH